MASEKTTPEELADLGIEVREATDEEQRRALEDYAEMLESVKRDGPWAMHDVTGIAPHVIASMTSPGVSGMGERPELRLAAPETASSLAIRELAGKLTEAGIQAITGSCQVPGCDECVFNGHHCAGGHPQFRE